VGGGQVEMSGGFQLAGVARECGIVEMGLVVPNL
jgi:hypothetical protein